MDRCDQCGFVYDEVGAADLADRLASFGPRFRVVTASVPEQIMRAEPNPPTWSALAYCCHVRDVFLAQRERFYQALVEDRPNFVPIYRDLRPGLAHYSEQTPARVLDQLEAAADLIADAYGLVDPVLLERLCTYNFPTPTTRSLVWVGQHTVHEGEHHLRDVVDALRAATGGR
jgi:hypothetical protein